jgi:carbamoyl-phosphate synthase large subunit
MRRNCARVADRGLRASPVTQVLIEQSVLGWKEYELEVMRDRADNFVVVCSIENLDPMGVHTGDSITIAPAMTLTDREYQRLREMAKIIIRTVGVETGGSNIQFAVNPRDGTPLVIEMNPRVSRSSALASKATGFPIAKIAALLAVGYTLDEIPNDITRVTPASFEPSLDYVVVKIPRWAFEKFPGVDPTLGPQMKSVGEVMAIGATFNEALQKAIRGLEIGAVGFGAFAGRRLNTQEQREPSDDDLRIPTAQRIFHVADALRAGWDIERIAALTGYDPWFVAQMRSIIDLEAALARHRSIRSLPTCCAKRRNTASPTRRSRSSFSRRARCRTTLPNRNGRARPPQSPRHSAGLPSYRHLCCRVRAYTPYLYSTYATADESAVTDRPKAIILGGGPNRIGQGIEFDYCCVHASFALRDLGYETIMINCNPETVSTDYDTSDRLYFEPLTLEDVLNVWENESGRSGDDEGTPVPMLVQFGGQTPLNLAKGLAAAGVPIWGTSQDSIDLAEDRGRFSELLRQLDIMQPESGMAADLQTARLVAQRIGYPVLVRPSYVLGGRAMAIAYDDEGLAQYIHEATQISAGQPVLIDRYLEDAFELDVDAVGDGERVVIGGIMEHVEEAGVHSGDSAMVMPPYKVSAYHLAIIRDETIRIGEALRVKGLMNIQFAIKDDEVYVLEVNPRASRTVPFVAKAVGVPLARIAAQAAAGKKLSELGFTKEPPLNGFFVKEAVLPFDKFPGAAVFLSPEMRSTGEVMGHASTFGHAFAKAEMGANQRIPTSGGALLTVNDYDKGAIGRIARDLVKLGFTIYATRGTASWLHQLGLPAIVVNKVSEGSPHTVDLIASGKVGLVISTPLGSRAYADGQALRSAAIRYGVMLVTTLTGAAATISAIKALRQKELRVRSLQEHYRMTQTSAQNIPTSLSATDNEGVS